MAIMIVAASDARMYTIVYSNMAAVTEFFFVVCREPAIEINWLIDLKFLANKMTTKESTQTIYFLQQFLLS